MAPEGLAPHPEAGNKKRALLILVDECGFSLAPQVARTWAPRGQTPLLRTSASRARLNVTAGVSRGGKLYFCAQSKPIHKEDTVAFLRHLLRHSRRYVIVVWDRGPTHTAALTQRFLRDNWRRIEAHYLPTYAPELNPAEVLWAQMKAHEMRGLTPHHLGELKEALRLAVMRIRAKPWLVRSFFRGCELPFGRGRWMAAGG